eukprot:434823_1
MVSNDSETKETLCLRNATAQTSPCSNISNSTKENLEDYIMQQNTFNINSSAARHTIKIRVYTTNIRSMLFMMILFLFCFNITSCTITSFGFHVTPQTVRTTLFYSQPVRTTLFWDNDMLQCDLNANPNNTWFLCDITVLNSAAMECRYNMSSERQHKMILKKPDLDIVWIDEIKVVKNYETNFVWNIFCSSPQNCTNKTAFVCIHQDINLCNYFSTIEIILNISTIEAYISADTSTCPLPPTSSPIATPSTAPTEKPTKVPTSSPITTPSTTPTEKPTRLPTSSPITTPSTTPTGKPTRLPTLSPIGSPSRSPLKGGQTYPPTLEPTYNPTVDDPRISCGETRNGTLSGYGNITSDYVFEPTDSHSIVSLCYQHGSYFDNVGMRIINSSGSSVFKFEYQSWEWELRNQECSEYYYISSFNDDFKPGKSFTIQAYIIQMNLNYTNVQYPYDIKLVCPNQQELPYTSTDVPSLILISFFGLCIFVGLSALLHNKLMIAPCKLQTDSAKWKAIIFYGFEICNILSNIILAAEIFGIVSNEVAKHDLAFTNTDNKYQYEYWESTGLNSTTDIILVICGALILLFLLVSCVWNIKMAIILPHENVLQANVSANIWFEQHSILFRCMTVFCGGTFPAIVLISSNIFGISALDSGLCSFEIFALYNIKESILQNVPMIVVQIMYGIVNPYVWGYGSGVR